MVKPLLFVNFTQDLQPTLKEQYQKRDNMLYCLFGCGSPSNIPAEKVVGIDFEEID